jgi:hypothetical protein
MPHISTAVHGNNLYSCRREGAVGTSDRRRYAHDAGRGEQLATHLRALPSVAA